MSAHTDIKTEFINGYRVKLVNRRVFGGSLPDGRVALKWVSLSKGKRREKTILLTPEAAAATMGVLMETLQDLRRRQLESEAA
jgi:hypothetical protein